MKSPNNSDLARISGRSSRISSISGASSNPGGAIRTRVNAYSQEKKEEIERNNQELLEKYKEAEERHRKLQKENMERRKYEVCS